MRMMTFAKRCTKEILRDPINLGFGLGFPLVLLLLLSAIQANIPVKSELQILMSRVPLIPSTMKCWLIQNRPSSRK